MKKTVLCLILLLGVAPLALAGMEYDPMKNRWEFVPDTNEEMKFKTPEDEWSYRKPGEIPAEKPEELPAEEPEEVPAEKPEEVPPEKPEEVPARETMIPPPMLPHRK